MLYKYHRMVNETRLDFMFLEIVFNDVLNYLMIWKINEFVGASILQ